MTLFRCHTVRVFIAFCVAVLFSSSLFAQGTEARITGIVTDRSKAVIRNAQVIATNEDTGVQYHAQTNSSGIYLVPSLIPGSYRVEVQSTGFKSIIKPGLTLHVQDVAEINFEMAVGSASESVTVSDSGVVLNTTDATVGTVIDRKFVENIPLNGRSFQDLISMTPGVVTQSPQNGSGIGTAGDFSINGQRTASNYYTVDGVSANLGAGNGSGSTGTPGIGGTLSAGTVFGTTQSLISIDALQEFRVQSSTYSAEYGHSPGGQISFATRSGTNGLHGSVYDYLRNNFFDANDWFNDHYGTPIASLRQNDFGGTLGGPIWIPRLYDGKNKAFFFVSYEGLRLDEPQAATIQYVPDTYLREQAPALLQSILNAFPLQTGIDYGSPESPSLAQFIKSYSLPGKIDSTSMRLDYTFSPKLSMFFRFGDTPSSKTSRILSAIAPNKNNTLTYTFGATARLLDNLDNEFRLGYARTDASSTGTTDDFGGAIPVNLESAMGLGGYPTGGTTFYLEYSGIGASYLSTSGSSGSQNDGRQWNVTDTSSFSHGRHLIRFGIDYRRIKSLATPASPNAEGIFESTSSVLTNMATELYFQKAIEAEPIFNEIALFAQDEWHIASRLNFSLGLRWEVNPPPVDAHGNDAYTVLGDINNPSSLTLAPRGTPLWKTPWLNFAPRLGAAWIAHNTPGWETVVRAGAGVFFDTNSQVATSGFDTLGFRATHYDYGAPLPVTSAQLDFSTAVTPPYTSSTVDVFPTHLQLPYALEWNVSLEQAIGNNQALTLSYVGSNGRRLAQAQTRSITTLNPDFGTIVYFASGVTSSYNALQGSYQRKLMHGVQALASYTWSHSLDFGSNYTSYAPSRGNSDFDVRSSFSAALSWDLPKSRGARFVRTVANGWGIDARAIARTAFPVTLQGAYLTDPATGNSYYGNVNLVPNEPTYIYGSKYPGGKSLNPAAFAVPKNASDLGDAPRNFTRGFGETQFNTAVRRDFKLYDDLHLQFRAEAFNLLNHPNFGAIDPVLTTAQFGQADNMLNTSLGTVASQYQQGGSRSMQFALRLLF